MNDTTIKVRENGPYLVRGPVTLTDANGAIFTIEGENIALCRCGASENKPFCDGSHKANGFTSVVQASPPDVVIT